MNADSSHENVLAGFARFDLMVTPTIIQAIFWVGSVALFLGGTAIMRASDGRLLFGLSVAILGPLMLRVYCEVLILVFKIHERANAAVQLLEDIGDGIDELALRTESPRPSI